jgi:hypothetical protein
MAFAHAWDVVRAEVAKRCATMFGVPYFVIRLQSGLYVEHSDRLQITEEFTRTLLRKTNAARPQSGEPKESAGQLS